MTTCSGSCPRREGRPDVHTVIEAGSDGTVLETPGQISKSGTTAVVTGKLVNHFNVHTLTDTRMAARWHNALQQVAEQKPHGIPVTVSTDPRHGFIQNTGTSFAAAAFSQWPEPIGLAAINDVGVVAEFADIARKEYVAVGIRAALHPTVDLATEPRWARGVHTLGADSELTSVLVDAYLDGMRGARLGATSVACTTKHFPAVARRRTARTRTSRTDASRPTPAAGSPSTSHRSGRRSSTAPPL